MILFILRPLMRHIPRTGQSVRQEANIEGWRLGDCYPSNGNGHEGAGELPESSPEANLPNLFSSASFLPNRRIRKSLRNRELKRTFGSNSTDLTVGIAR
jgi:hypothetical protein